MLYADVPIGLDKLEQFGIGVDHSEGIAITPDGTVYVGGEAGQIYRIEDDLPVEVARTGGFMLGLASDADGRIYAIDNGFKCVWRFDPSDTSLIRWLEGTEEDPIHVPNWGAFGPDGSYYLTDSGDWYGSNGRIWVKSPSKALAVFSVEAERFPNGCAVSEDGRRLWYVESAPTGAICSLTISEDGTAGPRKVHCELGLAVPDGVAISDDGGLIIACYRPDVIYRWSERDGLSILAGDPQGTVLAGPTNVAFGGPGLRTLMVPNLGRWSLARGDLGVAGVPLWYPTRDQLGD